MKSERYKIIPAIFVVLINKKNQVLLHRRCGTGYMDGYYDFPSGHLEEGESLLEGAMRELKEETDIAINAEDLILLHINQNYSDPQKPYINFMFLGQRWSGTPRICENTKCDHIDFFDQTQLPKVTPLVQNTLRALKEEMPIAFSYFGIGTT